MTAVMFYIHILLCSLVSGVSYEEQQILDGMAEIFLNANTDFSEAKKNADFFPLTSAMEVNRF